VGLLGGIVTSTATSSDRVVGDSSHGRVTPPHPWNILITVDDDTSLDEEPFREDPPDVGRVCGDPYGEGPDPFKPYREGLLVPQEAGRIHPLILPLLRPRGREIPIFPLALRDTKILGPQEGQISRTRPQQERGLGKKTVGGWLGFLGGTVFGGGARGRDSPRYERFRPAPRVVTSSWLTYSFRRVLRVRRGSSSFL
jgi:hypothetical protein